MNAVRFKVNGIVIGTVALAAFALLGSFFVSLTEEQTRTRIATNERNAMLQQLHALVPPSLHDNDLLVHSLRVNAPSALGRDNAEIYIATLRGTHQATIYSAKAPDGYSGPIELLVAIDADNKLLGVRVTQHRETPGLGDGIERRRSDWILQFDRSSLQLPPPPRWQVKKDGGDFDQLTGATVTSRALVAAVKRVLDYHQAQGEDLLAAFRNKEDHSAP